MFSYTFDWQILQVAISKAGTQIAASAIFKY